MRMPEMLNDSRRGLTAFACTMFAAFLMATLAPGLVAQQPATSSWNGAYSAEQAKRGEALYKQTCAICHGGELAGGVRAPAVGGPAFAARWSGRPLNEL